MRENIQSGMILRKTREFVLHRRLSPGAEGIHIAACSSKYILLGAEGKADNGGKRLQDF
jgi:hypothetical protein